jgi:hypothetical protein
MGKDFLTWSPRRFKNRRFRVHSDGQSVCYTPKRHPDALSPLGLAQCFAFYCNQPVLTGVSGLFCFGGPPNIPVAVPKVVVNSVNRVSFGWARANLFKKRQKVMLPLVTNGNAASTVINVRRFARIGASPNNTFPNFILFRLGKSVFFIPPIDLCGSCCEAFDTFIHNLRLCFGLARPSVTSGWLRALITPQEVS